MLSALQPSPGGGGEATTGLAESMEKRRVLEHLPRIASGFNSGPAHLPPVGTISPALKHNWNLPCTAKPSPVFWLFLHVRSQISGGVSFLPASPVPAARHPGFSRLSAGLSALHRPRGACRAQGSGREGSQGRLVLRHQVPQSPVSRRTQPHGGPWQPHGGPCPGRTAGRHFPQTPGPFVLPEKGVDRHSEALGPGDPPGAASFCV